MAWEVDDYLFCHSCFSNLSLTADEHDIEEVNDLSDRLTDIKSDHIDQGCSTGVIISLNCHECGVELQRV